MRRLALASSLVALSFAGLIAMAHAQPKPADGADAILILDASGSMWGLVGGQSKIAAARTAVGAILSQWKPSDRLGLMAYGHRSKSDCRDIELVTPVGPMDAAKIKAAVAGLNPKGKTPLTDSLRQAAATLKVGGKGTIILVSDGVETCNADPCAAAAELKRANVGLVAHVIGFDIADPVAKTQLQCIARNTGGVYLNASDAGGLQTALSRAVDATQGRKVASEAPARAATEDPFKGKPLRATLRLAEGLDPVTDKDVTWILYRAAPDGEEKGEYIATEYGARLAMAAEPGKYVLGAEIGQARRLFGVDVQPGKIASYDLVLDAGYVTSEGALQGSGAKVENVAWEVRSAAGESLTTAYEPVPKFVLPAGDYEMRLTKGAAVATKAFKLAAGDSINLAMTLDAGKLLVDAVYSANGPKVESGLAVEVRRPPKAENEEGEWIATNYDPLSAFDLPTGVYDVKALVGKAPKIQRVEIKSGQPTRITMTLDAGVLAMTAPGAESIEIVSPKKDINGNRKWLDTFYDSEVNIAFSAGDYIAIVTRAGGAKKETPVKVVAGERNEVTLAP